MKVPADAETDPSMHERLEAIMAGLRRKDRYMRVIERDPGFDKAVRLSMTILAHALHSARDMGDILDEDDSRRAYLQFILGACRQVATACDLPPDRAAKLMAAALYSSVLDWTPSVARDLAREAAALDGAPGLEPAFAAGQAATLAWLASEEHEVSDIFRIFSLDPVLAHSTSVAPRLH